MDARMSNIERIVGIQEERNKLYEERRDEERRCERHNWKRTRMNQDKKEQDGKYNGIEEDWNNDHDYDY